MSFKQAERQTKCDADNYSIANLAIASGLSSSFAAIFGTPMDVVKVRAIRMSIEGNSVIATVNNQRYSGRNSISILLDLYKETGFKSLVRGYQLASATQLFRASSFMFFYEQCMLYH